MRGWLTWRVTKFLTRGLYHVVGSRDLRFVMVCDGVHIIANFMALILTFQVFSSHLNAFQITRWWLLMDLFHLNFLHLVPLIRIILMLPIVLLIVSNLLVENLWGMRLRRFYVLCWHRHFLQRTPTFVLLFFLTIELNIFIDGLARFERHVLRVLSANLRLLLRIICAHLLTTMILII